jgi:hypothetical protein
MILYVVAEARPVAVALGIVVISQWLGHADPAFTERNTDAQAFGPRRSA